MTYKTKDVHYRIQFDTYKNLFIVVDSRNEKNTATGNTIEQAIAQFKQLN
ncbi:hypothetical protein ACSFB8_07715 [Enterococcus faecalis]